MASPPFMRRRPLIAPDWDWPSRGRLPRAYLLRRRRRRFVRFCVSCRELRQRRRRFLSPMAGSAFSEARRQNRTVPIFVRHRAKTRTFARSLRDVPRPIVTPNQFPVFSVFSVFSMPWSFCPATRLLRTAAFLPLLIAFRFSTAPHSFGTSSERTRQVGRRRFLQWPRLGCCRLLGNDSVLEA